MRTRDPTWEKLYTCKGTTYRYLLVGMCSRTCGQLVTEITRHCTII